MSGQSNWFHLWLCVNDCLIMCGGVVHCMSLKVHKVISEFVLQADSTVVLDLMLPPVGVDEALCKHHYRNFQFAGIFVTRD